MNSQDFKMNGKYSICLDEYLPMDELHKIRDSITRGVVLSKQHFEPIEIGHKRAIFEEDRIEPKLFILEQFVKMPEYKELKRQGFTNIQIYDYVKYRYNVKSLGTKLLLRTYHNYSAAFGIKHKESLNKDTPAYENFPELKEWIQKANIFKEVGRILLFINELGQYTPTHCDYAGLETHKDQFIWINFDNRKKFYVYDQDFNKHYLSGEINIFDNATWHGSEPAEYACFTIRVDGLFTDEFLHRTGLYEHFNTTTA